MSNLIKISEAATLALHTAYMLAINNDRLVSTGEIAKTIDVSENHLAKVLQRLVKAGLVESIRGPKGGFKLAKEADKITLLDIYEVIEGKMMPSNCLLDHPVCIGDRCILGDLLKNVNDQIIKSLSNQRLSDLNTYNF